jgi:hypothetical protein
MAPDVETIAETIRESPDLDEGYRTMLRRVIQAGDWVLGPKRADAVLAELLLNERVTQEVH